MSVLEIVGGNDRRSMIKRYERKSKQEAIRELVDIIHCNWNQVEQLEGKLAAETRPTATTPSAEWHAKGEPDPHAGKYDCERAALSMGNLTDDMLANGVFLYDHRGGLQSIAWLTAAKERIRWLSRNLEQALASQQSAAPMAAKNDHDLSHWAESLKCTWPVEPLDPQGAWMIGAIDDHGDGDQTHWPVITVEADQYDAPGDSEKIAKALSALWQKAFAGAGDA